MNTLDREALRRRIRQKRDELDPNYRRAAADDVAAQLFSQPFIQQARHLAAYHAVGGELDPAQALERSLDAGTLVYLPVLDRNNSRTLHFRQWTPDTPMKRNRLGIPEPTTTAQHEARELDVVLVPLVACDPRGNRLGMGGGFYDTTFAWRKDENPGPQRLVGLAYDFQVVDRLKAMPWDVPLDYIATPDGVITCLDG
jgi:5-formyltetrahydrofolate cyclo-ligase